jgi:pantothenate kinase
MRLFDVSHIRRVTALATVLDSIARFARDPRVVVGIAGPPGAGKSTLAAELAAAVGASAVVVPMDGFHLANAELARLGLADRKGAPETFDAGGFVSLLERIARRDELVYAPVYSRTVHESIGSAIPIPPTTRVVIVEGNYLLMTCEPWARVRALLDVAVYVEVADEVRIAGLIQRQLDAGRDLDTARDWVLRSDEANARIVAATRARADVVVTR